MSKRQSAPSHIRTRGAALPLCVLFDAMSGEPRCVNGLHVETFIPNPHGNGTVITFSNGDSVTVIEDFDDIVNAFMGTSADG